MAMTFLQLQDSVLHQLGDFSGATRTKAKRWLNDTRNTVWEQVPGQYKEQTDYVATTAAYESTSAITVTVTNGSTTVTSDGSSDTAFTSAMVGRYINLNGTDPWYRIASRTSATEIVLEDAYLGDSDTACAFSVNTWTWAINSDVDRLIQVTIEDSTNWRELDILDRVDFYANMPIPLRWTGTYASVCFLDENDASGNKLLGVWEVPANAALIRYRYEQAITEMSADADTVAIPGADNVVKAGALMEAFSFKGKPQMSAFWLTIYEKELDRLLMSVPRTRRTKWRMKDNSHASASRTQANMGSTWPRV